MTSRANAAALGAQQHTMTLPRLPRAANPCYSLLVGCQQTDRAAEQR